MMRHFTGKVCHERVDRLRAELRLDFVEARQYLAVLPLQEGNHILSHHPSQKGPLYCPSPKRPCMIRLILRSE